MPAARCAHRAGGRVLLLLPRRYRRDGSHRPHGRHGNYGIDGVYRPYGSDGCDGSCR